MTGKPLTYRNYWRELDGQSTNNMFTMPDVVPMLVKVMLVSNQIDTTPNGGRELLCKLNHDVLLSIYGERLVVFELPDSRVDGALAVFNAFRGYIDGVSESSITAALGTIREHQITQVFVDGSNLGGFVAVLKQRLPEVEVTTFFHNVESRFFWGAWRQHPSLRSLSVMLANYLAERKSVRYSDKLISLSERDSRLLKIVYGRAATHIAPMVMEDKCPESFLRRPDQRPEHFALFVGGTFYANRVGIEWFVREVVPRIDLPIYIVGRGFEELREELEIPGKVIVVGAVESLADWYHRAQFVIAPIFDGSGMKTKVAEALMYGKKIVGTPEAFSGYEHVVDKAGWVCDTVDDFVVSIGEAAQGITTAFDADLREIYVNKYSFDAARDRLEAILLEN